MSIQKQTAMIRKMQDELIQSLSCFGMDGLFRVEEDSVAVSMEESDGENISVYFNVFFEYGNLKREHSILMGWNDDNGVGIEYGEDADIQPCTYGSVMSHLYFCLAMEGLDDEFLQ